MNKLSGDLARDLERSLPAVASLGSSLSHSQSLSSHFLLPPPEKRQTISDVRRTFCLFVTFDLLFIPLLWIIELNVSGVEAGGTSRLGGDTWALYSKMKNGKNSCSHLSEKENEAQRG